jgi:site-specific recombinase XerD
MFAEYLGNEAYVLPANYAPKKSSFVPHIFTDAELKSLFQSADNLTIKGGRDPFLRKVAPVILRLLYTCGLRPIEARLLKRDNINFSTGEALIMGKGHRERSVVMSDDMLSLCKQYDACRLAKVGRGENFFVCSDGTEVDRRQLQSIFTRCWRLANPGVPAHLLPQARPYDLRHRYASTVLQKWLDEGRDLYAMLAYLRAYMGHNDLSATAYYIHILPEHLLKSPGVAWDKLDRLVPEVTVWED